MEILSQYMYDINIIDNAATFKNITGEDVKTYSKGVINDILNNKNKKVFSYESDSTEVVSIVNESIQNEGINPVKAELIANRLLRSEVETQNDVERLNVQLQRSALFQLLVKDEEFYFVVFSKVENWDYLDTTELIRRSGLPYKDKAFKNCLFRFNHNGELIDIFLSDKNNVISKYWSESFLELVELTTDEVNTKKVYGIIIDYLRKSILKKSPSDYTIYRNNVIGYFDTQDSFSVDSFLDYTFGSSEPFSSEIDITKIRTDLATRIDKSECDTSFEIIKTAIKKKSWQETSEINEYASITTSGSDDAIKESVQSVVKDGIDYIMVKSTNKATFEKFNWDNKEEE